MTDLRQAAEMMAYEVPLHELLEGVPENARIVINSEDGMSTSFIPVGQYCKRAASALRQALAQEQDYEVTHNDDGTFSVSLPEGDELRIVPPKREWVGLIKGVRVEGDKVIIATKDNDAARELCGKLIEEKNT